MRSWVRNSSCNLPESWQHKAALNVMNSVLVSFGLFSGCVNESIIAQLHILGYDYG